MYQRNLRGTVCSTIWYLLHLHLLLVSHTDTSCFYLMEVGRASSTVQHTVWWIQSLSFYNTDLKSPCTHMSATCPQYALSFTQSLLGNSSSPQPCKRVVVYRCDGWLERCFPTSHGKIQYMVTLTNTLTWPFVLLFLSLCLWMFGLLPYLFSTFHDYRSTLVLSCCFALTYTCFIAQTFLVEQPW